MASKARRRKRRTDYRPPPRRGDEAASDLGGEVGARERPPLPERRPPAPWGSFPLVELVILLSIVLLIAGFVVRGDRGVTMIVAGMTLGLLAGLELSIREHFGGYRSHTSVLSGAVTVVVLGATFAFGLPPAVKLLVGAIVFAAGFYLFREAFKRRSGGLGFR